MSESRLKQWLSPRRSEIMPGFSVGPFVFLDHMGPHTFAKGQDSDVAPHPHIGLATVTYLFEGEIEHRDSIGSVQRIKSGDVNWMTAGKGIVHSERAPSEVRESPATLHGLQAWVALPIDEEDVEPTFEHRDGSALPVREIDGVVYRLIAGEALGLRSPVRTFSRLFYVHTDATAGASIRFDTDGLEAAFYLVSGEVEFEGTRYAAPGLLHFVIGSALELRAKSPVTGMWLGGEPLIEHRRIWWNFVSAHPEKIEAAKAKWRAQTFPKIPGETEFVPLPN